MDTSFWHKRWEDKNIGFHRDQVNPLLERYLSLVVNADTKRIFVPLCGKTVDIKWLLSQGFQVCGVELVKKVVEELFEELGLEPKVETKGSLFKFTSENIEIFSGDFFDLVLEELGSVDLVYDRAAIVALPLEMRSKYAEHLRAMTGQCPQMVISYDYNQSIMDGPPFSVSQAEFDSYYSDSFNIDCIHSDFVAEPLKGNKEVKEEVRLLIPKH
ncbi:MAG: thiopurine S-methyltransferase [Bdellovibrionaceae bacterium]|nr:thiopurine S-methyltransferase [Pseudobdellovibrionaceae bacterium]|tara:strand:- start:71828 stop:72469 length:642 start_codon:yes stop_codon:yes gene_type:complete